MAKSPDDLRGELDNIGEPPSVDDLTGGSGVPAQSSVVPCDQIHCDDIQALISSVQTWLDSARERLGELDGYVNSGELERVISEGQLLANDAEVNGYEESDYQDVVDDAVEWKGTANDHWNELHGQKSIEAQTKNALESTHTHCCYEWRWYHDWLHGE